MHARTHRMLLAFRAVMGMSCRPAALALKVCAAFSSAPTVRPISASASHSSFRILALCSLAVAMACVASWPSSWWLRRHVRVAW